MTGYSARMYTYTVAWSPVDGEHVVTVAEFPSLSWLDEHPAVALAGAMNLVDDILGDMAQNNETAPLPAWAIGENS